MDGWKFDYHQSTRTMMVRFVQSVWFLTVYNWWGPIWVVCLGMHPCHMLCGWVATKFYFVDELYLRVVFWFLEGTTKSTGHPQHSGALKLGVKAHWEAPSHWQVDCLCWYVDDDCNCICILEVDTLIVDTDLCIWISSQLYVSFSWHLKVWDVQIIESEKQSQFRNFSAICVFIFYCFHCIIFSRDLVAEYCWILREESTWDCQILPYHPMKSLSKVKENELCR